LPLIDECLDVVEELYNKGTPVKEIASRCHNSMSMVYKALRRLEREGRIKRRRKGYRHRGYLGSEELEEIARLYREGMSLYAISKKIDRPVSTVYYAVKKLGL